MAIKIYKVTDQRSGFYGRHCQVIKKKQFGTLLIRMRGGKQAVITAKQLTFQFVLRKTAP